MDERCELKATCWESSAALFASWKAWAELAGEFVGSQKQFGEKLEARGIQPSRRGKNRTRGYEGISLIEAAPSPQHWEAN